MSSKLLSPSRERRLEDLISVGPAMLRDFELLGIRNVAQLAQADPRSLYRKLNVVTRRHHDICVLDVFRAAVAQARNPRLPRSSVYGGIGAANGKH